MTASPACRGGDQAHGAVGGFTLRDKSEHGASMPNTEGHADHPRTVQEKCTQVCYSPTVHGKDEMPITRERTSKGNTLRHLHGFGGRPVRLQDPRAVWLHYVKEPKRGPAALFSPSGCKIIKRAARARGPHARSQT